MTEYLVNGVLKDLNITELANSIGTGNEVLNVDGSEVEVFTRNPFKNPLSNEEKYKRGAEEAERVAAKYRRTDLSWMERHT